MPKTDDGPPLSDTQKRMVEHCANGLTVTAMATAEHVAFETIRSRLKVLYELYGVDNRAQLVAATRKEMAEQHEVLRAKVRSQAGQLGGLNSRTRMLEQALKEAEERNADLTRQLERMTHVATEWRQKYDATLRTTGWLERNQGQL